MGKANRQNVPQETRDKAVAEIRSGKTYDEVAKIYGVHPSSIFNWIKKKKKVNECRKSQRFQLQLSTP